MTNYVAGHVDNVEDMDSCIGVEFDPEQNQIVAYINEEEMSLTYRQAFQLRGFIREVINEYEWHNAEWISASYTNKHHLQKKGAHGEKMKTLCGLLPPTWGTSMSSWTLDPVVEAPSNDTCKRCLAIYAKQIHVCQPEADAQGGAA